tara:strand:- start:1700 stop:2680 length:981 start_codon:yes stop_codon:yes gene_type:complete
MSVVNETVLTYLPPKRKTTPSGWTSFNAPCCHHNGTSADTRLRGGLITNPDGLSFHCFNCGYKASWQQGRNLSIKMRKLLQWLNAPDDIINKLALTVMQENEGVQVTQQLVEIPKFNTVPMPDDVVKVSDITRFDKHSLAILEYMALRRLQVDDTEYYWSPSLGYRDRLIVPFYYEKRIVGWTARTVQAGKQPKYLSEQQPGYVFNLDTQRSQKIFVIVCEGPVDALYIDGVALLGSEAKDQQALLINRLNKDVIVVPDRDHAGSKLVEQAIDLGWGVSMPNWETDITDIGEAVQRYGRIFTLHSIASNAQTSPLKIRLGAKKWFT